MTKSDFMPIERYYTLKAVFERIWGKGTYLELKHCSDLKVWKRYCDRTLQITLLAAHDTVQIADDDWFEMLEALVEHGRELVKIAETFDSLFQAFAASYVEISFHQMGFMPSVYQGARSQLRKGNWRLDPYRTVQYVQSSEQKERLAQRKEKLQEQRKKLETL